MQKITPFLWFDGNAEEAMSFYTSIFKDAKVTKVSRYGEAGPGPKGTLMTAAIQLEGQEFILLNGGPMYRFTEAISFVVNCKTQEEIDYYWDRLLKDGGVTQACGWLKDKFGLSWQITPIQLGEFMSSGDAQKSNRVMKAMLQMIKLDINVLQRAYDGK